MGSFPESQGKKYILLIGSQFSKWYDAVALPNQEAKTLSKSFVEHNIPALTRELDDCKNKLNNRRLFPQIHRTTST